LHDGGFSFPIIVFSLDVQHLILGNES
jgi:hypothetical protein